MLYLPIHQLFCRAFESTHESSQLKSKIWNESATHDSRKSWVVTALTRTYLLNFILIFQTSGAFWFRSTSARRTNPCAARTSFTASSATDWPACWTPAAGSGPRANFRTWLRLKRNKSEWHFFRFALSDGGQHEAADAPNLESKVQVSEGRQVQLGSIPTSHQCGNQLANRVAYALLFAHYFAPNPAP